MRIFGRKKAEKPVAAEPPRLSGYKDPHNSLKASDAFVEVLIKAATVRNPSTLGDSYGNPFTELQQAIEIARLWCNEELGHRLTSLHEAVMRESTGIGSSAETDEAREHFALGCRIALGRED